MSYQSLYSWYGNQPPEVDYIPNTDAKGFVAKKQEQGASDYVGVLGNIPGSMRYQHTGIRNLGNMTINLRPFDSLGNPARDTFVRGGVGNFTTRYQNNSDDIPSITARGFERDGASSISFTRTAKDEFNVDDVTFSNRGIAKRKAQLGDGSKFPIGPAGQIHNFDIVRTGFFNQSRYGDTYGPESKAGLANTYTNNSPIDDMYNKYKVRDEAYNPFTFPVTRQPFVLRGIQRDDNSDPQRWGLGGTTGGNISSLLDIPRGGPLAFGERTAFDVVRLGKFAISPKGLTFITKQFGMQFMNPNTENITGTARGLRLTQIYDPTSFLLNTATAGIGIRFDRHMPPILTRGKYGQIHRQRLLLDQIPGPVSATQNNRLVQLSNEYHMFSTGLLQYAVAKLPIGLPSTVLSGLAGPKSVLGLGFTRIRRTVDTTAIHRTPNGGFEFNGAFQKRLGGTSAVGLIGSGTGGLQKVRGRQYPISKASLNLFPPAGPESYIDARPSLNPRFLGLPRRDLVDRGLNLRKVAKSITSNTVGSQYEPENILASTPLTARRVFHDSLRNILENNMLWLDNTSFDQTLTMDTNLQGGGIATTDRLRGTESYNSRISGKHKWNTLKYFQLKSASRFLDAYDAVSSAAGSILSTPILDFRLLAMGDTNGPDNARYLIDVDENDIAAVATSNSNLLEKHRLGIGPNDIKIDGAPFSGGGQAENYDIETRRSSSGNRRDSYRTTPYQLLRETAAARSLDSNRIHDYITSRLTQRIETYIGEGNSLQISDNYNIDRSRIVMLASRGILDANVYETPLDGGSREFPPNKIYNGGWRPQPDTAVNAISLTTKYGTIRALSKNRNFSSAGYAITPNKIIDFRKARLIEDLSTIRDDSAEIQYDGSAESDPYEGYYPDNLRYEHYKPQYEKQSTSARKKDLIKFRIGSTDLYAYITALSDTSSPSFDAGQDIGTILPRYQYTSYERSISVTFLVPAFNFDHLKQETWPKLKTLMANSQRGGSISITIGNIYRSLKTIITDMNCNWDVEYPWELDPCYQLPKVTEVSMTFKVLSKSRTFDPGCPPPPAPPPQQPATPPPVEEPVVEDPPYVPPAEPYEEFNLINFDVGIQDNTQVGSGYGF